MSNDSVLRQHILYLLRGGGAHLSFDKAVASFPPQARGKRIKSVPYTAWQVLEHMRIAQWDILEFSRNPLHASPEWPEGYWPKTAAPPSGAAWAKSVKSFRADLAAMQQLVEDPSIDLFARIPHGEGQTILREALLVADHNAYHLGQLFLIKRMVSEAGV